VARAKMRPTARTVSHVRGRIRGAPDARRVVTFRSSRSPTVNDEVTTRALDMLASGAARAESAIMQAAPHVWDAEVAYWQIQGATFCIGIPLALLACVACVMFCVKRCKGDDGYVVVAVITALVAISLFVAMLVEGSQRLAMWLIPETFAIHNLLESFK